MNVVAHNLAAMNASRQLNITTNAKHKSAEKLSSGYRINRSADDAAGLSISEKMRAQMRGLEQGAENIEMGISYAQVADGALEEVHAMLHRINELAIQSANGTNSQSDREAIDAEVQQLKTEMQRVFETTTFNDKQIWPEEGITKIPVWNGTKPIQAVEITTPRYQTFSINNDSYDKVAYDRYMISADDAGVSVSWTDYDGEEHQTTKVSWDVLAENDYSFQVGDYFDAADTELFDTAGNPIFDFEISMAVEPEATASDIIRAIDGTYMTAYSYVYMGGEFEDGSNNYKGVSVYSAGIKYSAAYASKENADVVNGENGYDFETPSDSFLEATVSSGTDGNLDVIPNNNSADLDAARTSTDTWKFTFEMDGIGEVTATSKDISYRAYDKGEEDYGIWWKYNVFDGRKYESTIYRYPNEYGEGSLGSAMAALTGNSGTGTPGILTPANGGAADEGGYIDIDFDLTSTNAFTYANGKSSNSVGSFTLRIMIDNTDTEQTVLDKINNALNEGTILDFKGSNSMPIQEVYKSSEKKSLVERDVYRIDESYKNVDINIHSGATTRDKIHMSYKCLRLGSIGLKDTDVLTEDSSTNAIREVDYAIKVVNEERARFGAYQNRMEHARAIDLNTAENTTAAESRIRDTDMAKEMVKYSKENILQQAGQSMMAQANQSMQGVLSLLN